MANSFPDYGTGPLPPGTGGSLDRPMTAPPGARLPSGVGQVIANMRGPSRSTGGNLGFGTGPAGPMPGKSRSTGGDLGMGLGARPSGPSPTTRPTGATPSGGVRGGRGGAGKAGGGQSFKAGTGQRTGGRGLAGRAARGKK